MRRATLLVFAFLLFGLAPGPAGAAAEPAGRLDLAPDAEPGAPLVVRVLLRDAAGEPLAGARVRAAQTDASGYYARDADGRELGSSRARLSGWVRTDAAGRFTLDTIRPAQYPGGGPPSHIHFRVAGGDGRERELTLYFDGPRLTAAARSQLERSGVAFFCAPGGAAGECAVELRLP
jgi:protocatechuate 3,4-dioxygenase beta subunit